MRRIFLLLRPNIDYAVKLQLRKGIKNKKGTAILTEKIEDFYFLTGHFGSPHFDIQKKNFFHFISKLKVHLGREKVVTLRTQCVHRFLVTDLAWILLWIGMFVSRYLVIPYEASTRSPVMSSGKGLKIFWITKVNDSFQFR